MARSLMADGSIPTSAGQVVPEWLVNLGALGWRILVSAVLIAVALVIAAALKTVTASVLIAVIVAAAFSPTVVTLRARGWSKIKAALAVTLGVLVAVTVAGVLIVASFIPSIANVANAVRAGVDRITAAIADAGAPPDAVANLSTAAQNASDWVAAAVGSAVGSISALVTVAILAGFLTFFLLLDGDRAWAWASQGISGPKRGPFQAAAGTALTRVGAYLRGTALISSGVALYDFAILYLLGVPLAAPLAVVAFLGGFIPYFGGLVAQTIILLVTLATTSVQTALVVLVLLAVGNVIRGDVVGPMLYGKRVKIHPAVVLISVPAGAAVAGVIGMFAAVPLVALVRAVAGALAAAFEPDVEPALPPIVPGWLDRLAQWSWRLLVAVGLAALGIGIINLLPVIVIPVVLGVIGAATFAPLVDGLVARGWRRGLASVTAVAGVTLGAVVIAALSLVSLVSQGRDLVAAGVDGATAADTASDGRLQGLVALIQDTGPQVLIALAAIAASVATIAITMLLGALLGFYLLRDGRSVGALVQRRFPDDRGRAITEVGTRSVGILSGYMIATGALSAFGALTQLATMLLLGLPLALPLAVLSFFGGFVPYIGSFITTGIALLVTIAVGSPTAIVVMLVFTIVFNILAGSVIGPLVYARAVNLHPAIVMVAIPAGSALAGIVGMFLAVPVVAIISATWRPALRVLATRPDRSDAAPQPPAPEPDLQPDGTREERRPADAPN